MEYFVYLKCENKHTIHTMTKVLYKSYTQNDYFLFPPCIGDFIPENHPVRTVNAILDNFDISEIESTYPFKCNRIIMVMISAEDILGSR